MAKSVRSRSTKVNRDRKRATGVFKDLAEARELRIAEKLHGSLEKAMATAQRDSESAESMQMDEEPKAKNPVKGLSTGMSKKKRAALKAKSKKKKGSK